MCGSQFINQDGSCVPKNVTDEFDGEWSSGSLNSTCQRIDLYEGDDYVLLDNGTIVLNSTGELIDPDQYETTANGSVQVCADEGRQNDYYFKYSAVQRILSDVCLAVSIVCLALHIAVHSAVPKLRNLPGKNLLSLSCSLFMAQLLFLTAIGAKTTLGYELCAAVAIITHWSYLAAFFWMNVMGFDICRTFAGQMSRHRDAGQRSNAFRFYSLYAWGVPMVIVSIGLALDLTHVWDDFAPRYGDHICWISNRSGLGIFFALPVGLLLLENTILFGVTVFSIVKQRRAGRYAVDKRAEQPTSAAGANKQPGKTVDKQEQKQKMRFAVYVKLALIMGLGWIFGFLAALAKLGILASFLWYPFILFNALQGTYIFIAFDCKLKIYYQLYLAVFKRPHPADTSASSRAIFSNKPSVSSNRRTSTQLTMSVTAPEMVPRAIEHNQRISSGLVRHQSEPSYRH